MVQSVVAAGSMFVLVCILVFQYGFPVLEILVVLLLFGLPAEFIWRRGHGSAQ
jgi:hypothetical protein